MWKLTELHAQLAAQAFERVLGRPQAGTMAFVRCLTPDVVHALGEMPQFTPAGWLVQRVANLDDVASRTITADHAVELREAKEDPMLLLVDTTQAGAGMDGIYSAAQEVHEEPLFKEALSLAAAEVTRQFSRAERVYAERAIKTAQGYGQRYSLAPWTIFDYLIRICAEQRHPGELVHLLGLWPIQPSETAGDDESLNMSRRFVDRLLGVAVAGQTPAQRINALKILPSASEQSRDLERFVRTAATLPLLSAMQDLAEKPHLWINALRTEESADSVQSIEWASWRNKNGTVAKWSGLIEGDSADDPPVFLLDPEAHVNSQYSKLEIRWRARPDNLAKDVVEYRVAILTDMDEELTARDVSHSAKKTETCRFTNDDFSMLNEDALIGAKVVISVIGDEDVTPAESDEFTIRFGEPPANESSGVGRSVRTLSEGLMELAERALITEIADATSPLPTDAKGFVLLRTPKRGKSFRVYRPPLLRDVERQWNEQGGAIGRWRVRVRGSGARATEPEFIALAKPNGIVADAKNSAWERAVNASRRMAERFAIFSGVGQIYDDQSRSFTSVVKEYLLAWTALLNEGEPNLALANTVEIQSLSGTKTIGLIVLPSHPLRVAWHVAYDNLVFHTAYDQGATPKEIRDEFSLLDGAMFPAFLPGTGPESSFVFADTLGFHTVGMIPDTDKEPKAAIAILARALGESETADTAPTVGRQSAQILSNEILKYIACHGDPALLHIHALRPGDGLTIARSLGKIQEKFRAALDDDDEQDDDAESARKRGPSFVLELYPSEEQRGVAGRFIAEAREKRRTGAGVLAPEDQWMLDSTNLPGGVSLPKLRWARKREQSPQRAAHLAVAFDTFESRVVLESALPASRPLYAYGLISFFERAYTDQPNPVWRSTLPTTPEGEKHPSDRTHSERLFRLQDAIQTCVAQRLGDGSQSPVLRTEISPEKADSLRDIHRLCDWVITLDRNAGIEYFDSPKTNRPIYDAYVIDAVPEREDLGCLQLITSTSNREEVRNLLDAALIQMALSQSRRNAEFLLENLKSLSGRLAIRLTSQKQPNSELIALALSHANCARSQLGDAGWVPLQGGFLIPVDDVLDLLPPLARTGSPGADTSTPTSVANVRPDLIYVAATRRGLSFQFVEVKYRRHLREARSSEILHRIDHQVQALRKRWDAWYVSDDNLPSIRAMRRAKLARMLRFYAEKAYRHSLDHGEYNRLVLEINRLVEKGENYQFAASEYGDRGWVFCPEFQGSKPMSITPPGWQIEVFLFGPGVLPDALADRDDLPAPVSGNQHNGSAPSLAATSTQVGAASVREQDPQPPVSSDPTAAVDDESSAIDAEDSQTSSGTQPHTSESSILLGQDLFTGSEVRWPLTIKGNPHLLLAGLPGMGKTTALLNICTQMLDSGIRPIIFSYHEDIDARLQERVDNVRFLDFQGLGFNPLQVIDRDAPMAYLDVAAAMRDIFVAIYPELGDIQAERIRKAIKDSFLECGWDNPQTDPTCRVEPPFRRFVEILRAEVKPDAGLRSLLSRLDELDDYGFFSPSQSATSIWDSEGPTIIRIHSTVNDNLQKAFASVVFYGLYKDMFRRGIQSHLTHAIIFDEAHRAARLKLIPTMAKECRKYGISLVLASQEAKDFNSSLFSAIANYLILRLNEADCKVLVRNVTTSDMERAFIDKIKQMERFKGYYFSEGRKKPSLVALSP